MLTLAWQPGQSFGGFVLKLELLHNVDVFLAFTVASQVRRQRRDHLISAFHSLLCERSVDAFRTATSEHYFKTNVHFKNMQNQPEILRLPEVGPLFKR